MALVEDLFSLSGKIALVSGGNSGIGFAIAESLALAGASVVLAARREAELEEATRRIRIQRGRAEWVACDLADRAAIADAATRAAAPFGDVDILVTAAGVNIRRPMEDITEADWDTTVAINLAHPFFLAKAVAPGMLRKGRGKIIHIASLQSVRAFANSGPYGATKGGIMQLVRAQAEAWSKHGICVNAIGPGFFPTPLTKPVFDDPARAAAMAARTMIGRNGTMDDLRGAAIFLASRASDYITGQTLYVDGGFTAG
jgi:NAD(P)-dependent dehydrogenase (short-subunit alcohol dehydrogenase family)